MRSVNRRTVRRLPSCPNETCSSDGSVVIHSFSKVKWGRRRRYRCKACGKTFGATTGTPYECLQHPKSKFDRVVELSVEGVNKSAIARIERLSWNTVARWLERAAEVARRFNAAKLRGYPLHELQLDELNTFLASRNRKTWVFTSIEVSSRLWPATLVGSRSYRNTRAFVRSLADSGRTIGCPLITTDGFRYYAPSIRRTFGMACVLAQVTKRIKLNRVIRVGTELIVGTEWRLADALEESEDSGKVNTSFV